MSNRPSIGVLALQGAFARHAEILKAMGASPSLVRCPKELEKCDALIIPGGESTTISKRIHFIGLREPLINFAKKRPVFGTCAGMILISKECGDSEIAPLGLLDIVVERNGYGGQYDSFSTEISMDGKPFHAVFIRAPRIKSASPKLEILASLGKEPILVRQGYHLGAAFHPELTGDPRIHEYFLNLVKNSQNLVFG